MKETKEEMRNKNLLISFSLLSTIVFLVVSVLYVVTLTTPTTPDTGVSLPDTNTGRPTFKLEKSDLDSVNNVSPRIIKEFGIPESNDDTVDSANSLDTTAATPVTCNTRVQDNFNGTTLNTTNWQPLRNYTKQSNYLYHTYKTSRKVTAELFTGNTYQNSEQTTLKKVAVNTDFEVEVDLLGMQTSGTSKYLEDYGLAMKVGPNLYFFLSYNNLFNGSKHDPQFQGYYYDSFSGSSNGLFVTGNVAKNKPATFKITKKGTTIRFYLNEGNGNVEKAYGNITNNDASTTYELYTYSGTNGSTANASGLGKFDNFTFGCSIDNRTYWEENGGKTATPISMVDFNGRLYQFVAGSSTKVYVRSTGDGVFDLNDDRENWIHDVVLGGPAGNTTKEIAPVVHNNQLFISIVGTDGRIYSKKLLDDGDQATEAEWEDSYNRVSADTKTTANGIASTSFNGKLYQFLVGTDSKLYYRYSGDGKFDATNEYTWKYGNGKSPFTPGVASYNGKIYVSVAGTTKRMFMAKFNDGELNGDKAEENFVLMQPEGKTDRTPTLAVAGNGRLYQAVRGSSTAGIFIRSTNDGNNWSAWDNYGGKTPQKINMSKFNTGGKNYLYQAIPGTSGNIFIRRYIQ